MYKCVMATLEDVEEFVELRMVEQENDWKGEYPITEELAEASRLAYLSRLNKDLFGFFIKKDGKIVATAFLITQQFLPQADDITGKRAYLCNVYTVPEERRKGHQNILMEAIKVFVALNNIKRIDLHATEDEYVFEMYKKLGYRFVSNNARLVLKKNQ